MLRDIICVPQHESDGEVWRVRVEFRVEGAS